jgi:hypothetical protein
MKLYKYKHILVPFSDEQMVMIGMPLSDEDRAPLDEILEKTLNDAGADGWRLVPPLVLPVVLLEREVEAPTGRPAIK